MSEKNEKGKISNWVSIVCQIIGTAILLASLMAYPLKMRFNYVEAKQNEFKQSIEKCKSEHEKIRDNMPNKDLINNQFTNLCEKIDALSNQITECQRSDKEFKDKFYEYILNVRN